MSQFKDMVDSLRRGSGRSKIALYHPVETRREDLYEALRSFFASTCVVETVDEVFLNSWAAMQDGVVDLLVIPELDLLRKEYYRPVKEYLDRGGAVLLAADDLFMTRRAATDVHAQFETVVGGEENYFRKTVAYLGIKPYRSDVAPTHARIDPDFVKETPRGPIEMTLSPWGAGFNVGSDRRAPYPPYGHVFPERYEVLRNYEVVVGSDPLGRRVCVPVVFAQNWETGARLALFTSNGEGSFVDPRNPHFAAMMEAAVSFCGNRIMAVSCRPQYACYRDGETVRVSIEAVNGHARERNARVVVEIRHGQTIYLSRELPAVFAPGGRFRDEIVWSPDHFDDDSYTIGVRIIDGARVLSRVENGFVVWKEEVAASGPRIGISGKYFSVSGRNAVLTGTNYYESNLGETMWIHPNIAKLEDDLRQMAGQGINYVRIHYHHPKWFRDYLENVTRTVPEYYADVDRTPIPSEAALRVFDAHIYLCQKYGIVYGGDLFTLIPKELGDPRGWYGVQDYLWFDDKIEKQKEFLGQLVRRYTRVPGIAWDLYNEPHGVFVDQHVPRFNAAFLGWSTMIRNYMRELGDTHLLTVGVDEPEKFDAAMDFYAEHRNYSRASELKCTTEKPEIFQEVWMDRPPTPEGDRLQMHDMRQALLDTFRTGLAGFSPWQWTNQQRLWADFRTYYGEIWDDRLGAVVRNDATLKPSGRFYRDFSFAIRHFEFLSSTGGVISTKDGSLLLRGTSDATRRGDQYIRFEPSARDPSGARFGLAKGSVDDGVISVAASCDCDLWYFLDGADAAYVKADDPCVLTVRLGRRPKNVEYCVGPRGTVLGTAEGKLDGTDVTLEIRDWQTYYWFRLSLA